jgi:cold shock CspA family protein
MAQIPDHPKKAFRKSDAPTWLSGVITRWQDGASFGFITGDDGESYFLSNSDLPTGCMYLPVGTAVTFTSPAAPEPGKRYLRARAVRPEDGGE